MTLSTIYFKDFEALRRHLRAHKSTLFLSSQTSTVIPFQFLKDYLCPNNEDFIVGQLSGLPPKMELINNNQLKISGGVTWHEALAYCRSLGRDLMTWPTEESANVLAGLATSATGERSFAFGSLRNQVDRIIYLNYQGESIQLDSKKQLLDQALFEHLGNELLKYQEKFMPYLQMKNGPIPRLMVETDLMIGTEGQLGIIQEAVFNTIPLKETKFLMIPLTRWEIDFNPHLEVFEKVQRLRGKIYSVEFFDSNSLNYLLDSPLIKDRDYVTLEIVDEHLDEVLEIISTFKHINSEDIFEISRKKYHDIRGDIPRRINEVNSQRAVTKKGTDAQVDPINFKNLLKIYAEMAGKGIPYALLGHFGDGHLHFNFLPTNDQMIECEGYLKDFYIKLKDLKGSPFAEHGIGIIKKGFVMDFFDPSIFKIFKHLKGTLDPFNQFFPQGYLNMYKGKE
jgi:FAD/FMN-containing dehydrogenase